MDKQDTNLLKVCHVIEVSFLKELLLGDPKLVMTGSEEGINVSYIGDLNGKEGRWSDRTGDHEREELRNSKQHIDNEMSGYAGQGSRKDVYFLLRLN